MELSLEGPCCLPRRCGDWCFWNSEETIPEGTPGTAESTPSSRTSVYVLSWGQWKPMMVLERGQPLKGLRSVVKSSVHLGMWGKCLTTPSPCTWGVESAAGCDPC